MNAFFEKRLVFKNNAESYERSGGGISHDLMQDGIVTFYDEHEQDAFDAIAQNDEEDGSESKVAEEAPRTKTRDMEIGYRDALNFSDKHLTGISRRARLTQYERLMLPGGMAFKEIKKYVPYITYVAKKQGIPKEVLIALIAIESGGKAGISSSLQEYPGWQKEDVKISGRDIGYYIAGGAGQFTPQTWIAYGFEYTVTKETVFENDGGKPPKPADRLARKVRFGEKEYRYDEVTGNFERKGEKYFVKDERLDIYKMIEGMAMLIKANFERYGNWVAAAAAYNGGGREAGNVSGKMDSSTWRSNFERYVRGQVGGSAEQTRGYVVKFAYALSGASKIPDIGGETSEQELFNADLFDVKYSVSDDPISAYELISSGTMSFEEFVALNPSLLLRIRLKDIIPSGKQFILPKKMAGTIKKRHSYAFERDMVGDSFGRDSLKDLTSVDRSRLLEDRLSKKRSEDYIMMLEYDYMWDIDLAQLLMDGCTVGALVELNREIFDIQNNNALAEALDNIHLREGVIRMPKGTVELFKERFAPRLEGVATIDTSALTMVYDLYNQFKEIERNVWFYRMLLDEGVVKRLRKIVEELDDEKVGETLRVEMQDILKQLEEGLTMSGQQKQRTKSMPDGLYYYLPAAEQLKMGMDTVRDIENQFDYMKSDRYSHRNSYLFNKAEAILLGVLLKAEDEGSSDLKDEAISQLEILLGHSAEMLRRFKEDYAVLSNAGDDKRVAMRMVGINGSVENPLYIVRDEIRFYRRSSFNLMSILAGKRFRENSAKDIFESQLMEMYLADSEDSEADEEIDHLSVLVEKKVGLKTIVNSLVDNSETYGNAIGGVIKVVEDMADEAELGMTLLDEHSSILMSLKNQIRFLEKETEDDGSTADELSGWSLANKEILIELYKTVYKSYMRLMATMLINIICADIARDVGNRTERGLVIGFFRKNHHSDETYNKASEIRKNASTPLSQYGDFELLHENRKDIFAIVIQYILDKGKALSGSNPFLVEGHSEAVEVILDLAERMMEAEFKVDEQMEDQSFGVFYDEIAEFEALLPNMDGPVPAPNPQPQKLQKPQSKPDPGQPKPESQDDTFVIPI